MAVTRVLLTIPSNTRVGSFACIVVIACTVLVFFLGFGNYTYDIQGVITKSFTFQPEILDIIAIFAIPIGFLYLYIVEMTRIRLHLAFKSWWIISHIVFFGLSFLISVYYIMCRPKETLSFVVSLVPEDVDISSFTNFIDKLVKMGLDGEGPAKKALFAVFDNNGSVVTNSTNTFIGVVMCVLASWSFVLQTVVAALFTAMACSKYGERNIIVGIKTTGDTYRVHVEKRSTQDLGKKSKLSAGTAA